MKRFIIPALLLAPTLVFAQGGEPDLSNFQTLLESFGNLVSLALPIVVAIALLGLFWGLAVFIFAAGSEEKKERGKHYMIWSLVALFVMVSVWGLVEWIGTALGITDGSTAPPLPGIPVGTTDPF